MTTAREGSYINALNRPAKLKNSSLRAPAITCGRKDSFSPWDALTEAAQQATFVRNVARPGSRRSEAELWSALPAEKRRWTQPCSRMLPLNGTQTSQGMVLSVTCAEGRHRGRRPECGRDKHLQQLQRSPYGWIFRHAVVRRWIITPRGSSSHVRLVFGRLIAGFYREEPCQRRKVPCIQKTATRVTFLSAGSTRVGGIHESPVILNQLWHVTSNRNCRDDADG